jgi:hypothetical protein
MNSQTHHHQPLNDPPTHAHAYASNPPAQPGAREPNRPSTQEQMNAKPPTMHAYQIKPNQTKQNKEKTPNANVFFFLFSFFNAFVSASLMLMNMYLRNAREMPLV